MIPTVISWMPPSSRTASSTVVIPETYWPASLSPIATGIPRKAIAETAKPSAVATCSGTCENEEIASSEKRNMRRGVYLVSPGRRGARS